MAGRRIPKGLEGEFKARIGSPVKKIENDDQNILITVGDVVSLTARKGGIIPNVSVYDGMTERRTMTEFATLVRDLGEKEAVVDNPPGMITRELFDALRNALARKEGLIRVNGEEDLAVLPCILLAPEGTRIVYGWPGEGMMLVTTTGMIKEEAERLWNMMEDIG
jgi:uncharacterized protein (UPF0218 family)